MRLYGEGSPTIFIAGGIHGDEDDRGGHDD